MRAAFPLDLMRAIRGAAARISRQGIRVKSLCEKV
jgi:hypothetical protein